MAPVLPPLWDSVLGNVSQSSALLVFLLIDPLQLQMVAWFSAVSQVVFYSLQRPPVFIFIFWNTLQAIINTTQVVKLSMELIPIKFTERELEVLTLMSRVFDEIPNRKIAAVLRRGLWVEHREGEAVVDFDQGSSHDKIVFVVEGTVDVFSEDGALVIAAVPGTFLAENALTKAMLEHDDDDDDEDHAAHLDHATASSPSLCVVWNVNELARMLKADRQLRNAFRQALAVDLCRKIELESVRRTTRSKIRFSSASMELVPVEEEEEDEHDEAASRKKSSTVSTLYRAVTSALTKKSTRPNKKLPERTSSDSSSGSAYSMRKKRVRRKNSVLSVMGFINAEDEASPVVDSSGSGSGYDSIRKKSSASLHKKVPGRPSITSDDVKRMRAARAAYVTTVLAALAALCFVSYFVYLQGPSSAIGNGSQVIITFAFAINDAFRLQLASFLGALSQTCFFLFRKPRILTSVAWSSAQATVNLCMAAIIKRSTATSKENVPLYSDKELFASRCLQRAAPKLDHPAMQILTVGVEDASLQPTWKKLTRGQSMPKNTVALVTDGSLRVTRSDGISYDATPGSLIGRRQSPTAHLSASKTNATKKSPPLVDEQYQAIEPCELISWPTGDLDSYLDTNQDARLAFSVLAASTAADLYLFNDADLV